MISLILIEEKLTEAKRKGLDGVYFEDTPINDIMLNDLGFTPWSSRCRGLNIAVVQSETLQDSEFVWLPDVYKHDYLKIEVTTDISSDSEEHF